MNKKYSVEQIVGVLKQAELGVPVVELIRKVGISEQTFYRWKKQHIGLEVDQVRHDRHRARDIPFYAHAQNDRWISLDAYVLLSKLAD